MKLPQTFILLLLIITLSFNFTFGSRRKNRKSMSRSDKHGGENSKNNTNNTNLSSNEYLRAIQPKEGGRTGGGGGRKRNRGESSRGTLRTTEEAKVITQKKFLKEDWCKSRNVRQNIRTTDDCRGKIINKFCYGHCNSFYIPSDIVVPAGDSLIDSADVNHNYFRSCSFCMPAVEEIVTVRLRCKNKNGRKVKTIRRKMKRTKTCTCVAVPDLAEKLPEKTDLASSTTVASTTTTAAGSTFTVTTAATPSSSSSTVVATDRSTTKGNQSTTMR